MRRGDEYFPIRRDRERSVAPWGGEIEGYSLPLGFSGGSPWQIMRRMQEDMDRIFGQLVSGQEGAGALATAGGQVWAPTMDISQTDREWRIEADLPGVKPD